MSNSAWACVLGLALTVLAIMAVGREGFEALEVRTVDWRFRMRLPGPEELPGHDPSLVLVEITSDCLETVGRWPWPRERLADLLNRISACGPRVIGLDIEFSERDTDAKQDKALAAAIARAGNVVLAAERRNAMVLNTSTGELEAQPTIADPLPEFKVAARATGLVNHDPYVENPDGVLRKTPLSMTVGEGQVPGFPLSVASVFLGTEPVFDEAGRAAIGSYQVPSVPTRAAVAQGQRSAAEAAEAFSQCAWVNFASLGHVGGYFQTVSASDILGGRHDPKALAGKMVLVGFSALGVERDQKLTPVGLMPGVEFQANVVTNLRDRSFLVRISTVNHQLLVGVLGVLLALAFSRIRLAGSMALALVVVTLNAGLSYQLFRRHGWLLDMVPVGALAVTQLVVVKLFVLATELARKIRNLELLNRYSRHFNATLQLDELKTRVLSAFMELSGASGGALAVVRDDTEELDVTTRGDVPERVTNILGRRSAQEELLGSWEAGPTFVDGTELVRRPSVAPDLTDLFESSVFIPACHYDRVKGWVMVKGPALRREVLRHEETDFWLTLSSIGLAAIENGLLYKLATVDALTSLFVRHFFDIQIEKSFGHAIRHKNDLALLMTDIDHFKKFNDQYGHQMGDRVLRMVAHELRRCVRVSDVACRYGGEEFCVVCPGTDLEGAKLLAERIRARVGELKIPYKEGYLEVHLSIGLTCTVVTGARTPKQFIEEADGALYRAKETGRNRVCAHEGPGLPPGPPDESLRQSQVIPAPGAGETRR